MPHHQELVRFDVLRNALYHTARRRFFERWNRIFNFLVVMLGTAVVADLTEFAAIPALYSGGAVAVIGTLQLVLDFGGQAREHQTRQREYYHLLADIESVLDPTDQQCAEWYSAMLRITANESPTYRVIDSEAHNDAIDAMDFFDQDERLVVPLWSKPFGSFFTFNGLNFRKIREVEAAKAAQAERKTGKQPA